MKRSREDNQVPPKKENIKVHYLKIDDSYRASKKLKPYKDSDGVIYAINHIKELVPTINRHLKSCYKNRAFKTYVDDDSYENAPLPPGMFLYGVPKQIMSSLSRKACIDIDVLFKDPKYMHDKRIHMLRPNAPPSNKILFYNRSGPQPRFPEVMKLLEKETPYLWEYITIYDDIISELLGVSIADIPGTSLSLVHYDEMAGLNPHVDTVHIFNATLIRSHFYRSNG